MPAKGLPVHSITVSCPYDDCDSLQTAGLHRNGDSYCPEEDVHVCTQCGHSFEIGTSGIHVSPRKVSE